MIMCIDIDSCLLPNLAPKQVAMAIVFPVLSASTSYQHKLTASGVIISGVQLFMVH